MATKNATSCDSVMCNQPTVAKCSSCQAVSNCGRVCERPECLATLLLTDLPNPDEEAYSLSVGDGIAIVESGSPLGRVIVARKDFAIGDVVLSESPALVFSMTDDVQHAPMVRAFMNADAKSRATVLNMCHPPLDSKQAQGHKLNAIETCELLLGFGADCDLDHQTQQACFERVWKLCLIRDLNCHSFTLDGALPEAKSAAFFSIASKVEHSCDPNVMFTRYTNQEEEHQQQQKQKQKRQNEQQQQQQIQQQKQLQQQPSGRLQYIATRLIKTGDRITFTYIVESDPETPTAERQESLQRTKFFTCACLRCAGRNLNRPVPCIRNVCGGVMFCTGAMGPFQCISCNATCTELEAQRAEKATLLSLKKTKTIRPAMVNLSMLNTFKAARVKASEQLPVAHYSHPQLLAFIAKIAASLAGTMSNNNKNSSNEVPAKENMNIEAASVTVELLLWRERMCAAISATRTGIERNRSSDISSSANRAWINRSAEASTKSDPRTVLKRIYQIWENEGDDLKPVRSNNEDAYYAGMDMKESAPEMAAVIFQRYEQIIMSWVSCPDRKAVKHCIERYGVQ